MGGSSRWWLGIAVVVLGASACASSSSTTAAPSDAAPDGDLGLEDGTPIGEPKACATDADCAPDQACAFPTGDCAAARTCVARRTSTGDAGSATRRYCGCDGAEVIAGTSYPDGWAPVATRGAGVCPGDGGADAPICARGAGAGCPGTPCPSGSVCAIELGGVAGGGGAWCAPIPPACAGAPSCACMGLCACGTFSGRAEKCEDGAQSGVPVLSCDDGVRSG